MYQLTKPSLVPMMVCQIDIADPANFQSKYNNILFAYAFRLYLSMLIARSFK